MRLETKGLTRVETRASPREGGVVKVLSEEEEEQCSTSSYSSIGTNSDVSSERSMAEDKRDSEGNEVESAYKYNGPLHAIESLEQVLPIRRGISNFYNGKSKSFTSLADAATSPSVKDIAKPENAYSRRRRNLLAFNHVWDKNRNCSPLRSNSGGISLVCSRISLHGDRSPRLICSSVVPLPPSSSLGNETAHPS